jgi:hypothetical protein
VLGVLGVRCRRTVEVNGIRRQPRHGLAHLR